MDNATGNDFMSNSILLRDKTAQIVFTGDDILWYNGSTKELRFKNNYAIKQKTQNSVALSFYFGDEYQFSSIIYVSSDSNPIFNYLVFYYNTTENKYFLSVGYPDTSVLSDMQNVENAEAERISNYQNIATEWNKFIDQLKKEGRYRH
jgi:hypothetical protein